MWVGREAKRRPHLCGGREAKWLISGLVCLLSGLDCLVFDLDCLISGLDCLISGLDCLISGLDCLISGLDWAERRSGIVISVGGERRHGFLLQDSQAQI